MINKELILTEIENFNEIELQKVFNFIKSLRGVAFKNECRQWSDDYKNGVLGNWQGELERPVDFVPEQRMFW